MTNLTCAQTYNVRAFATNPSGTGRGSGSTFATLACPTSGGATATLITKVSATLNSAIVSGSNITSRGFYVRPESSATYAGIPTVSEAGSFGTGNYSLPLATPPLTCNTKYYFKAYIIYLGVTIYGTEQDFTTLPCGAYISGTNPIDIGAGAKVYGLNLADSKVYFDNLNATPSGVTADLAVKPQDSATDYSVDVTINIWNKATTYAKQWVEDSTNHSAALVVKHTVGDLAIGKTYSVYYTKTAGPLTKIGAYVANSTGHISFDYDQGFTSVTFNVVGVPTSLGDKTSADPNGSWAWSSNIGWVSLDPIPGSTGIAIDGTTGNLSGYGWSSNIGWIKFGGLSSFPAAGGNANINQSTGVVSGWIRACAGTASGDCSTMTSRSDGWDGWIELSGTNHSSLADGSGTGVWMNPMTGALTGKAWGGDVVGWLDFDATIATVPLSTDCKSNTPSGGQVTFTALPSGGSGEYEYDWWNGSTDPNTFTSSVSKLVTYTSAGSVGQRLTVMDKNNNTSKVTFDCPSVLVGSPSPSPTFGGVTGTCNISRATGTNSIVSFENGVWKVILDPNIDGGHGYLTYTMPLANIHGGVSPYDKKYVWQVRNGIYTTEKVGNVPAANSYTADYLNDAIGQTTAKVYDSGTPQASGSAACGFIQVIKTPLSLYIGATGAAATLQGTDNEYKIRKGAPFGLKWENAYAGLLDETSAPMYNCQGVLSSVGDARWNGWVANAGDPAITSETFTDTANVDLGTYDFSIKCRRNGGGGSEVHSSNMVRLKITSVSQGEI